MAPILWPWKNKGEPEPTKINRQNLQAAEQLKQEAIEKGEVPVGAAGLPASVVSSSVAIKVLKESPGEAVNCSALIQAAYDEGYRHIYLDGIVKWLLEEPVFFDATVGWGGGGELPVQQVIIETSSTAPLILGPNLPTCSTFSPDTTVKWGFFPGTKRSGFNKGTNTVAAGTGQSVTSETQQAQPAVEYRGYIEGGARNIGIGFGNHCSQILACTTKGVKLGISWFGYTDHNGVRRGTHEPAGAITAGTLNNSWLVYQIAPGDGMFIEPVEMNGGGIWHCEQCFGGTCVASIQGEFSFLRASGVRLISGHWEMQGSAFVGAAIKVTSSRVTLDGPVWDVAYTGGTKYPFLEIKDEEGSSDFSIVTLNQPCARVYESQTDGTRLADIAVTYLAPNGRLIVNDAYAGWRYLNGSTEAQASLIVTSPVAAIKAALNHPTYTGFQRAVTQLPSWELRKQGSGGTWAVTPTPAPSLLIWPAQETPEGFEATPTVNIAGTLTEGSEYSYAIAVVDDNGVFTKATAEILAKVGSKGAISLKATLRWSPAGVMVWRKKGAGVLAEPEDYVLIPWPGTGFQMADTGANFANVKWVAASVPVPNTVAAATTQLTDYAVSPSGEIMPGATFKITATNTAWPVPVGAKKGKIIAVAGGAGGAGGGSASSAINQVGGAAGAAGVVAAQSVLFGVNKTLEIKIGAGGKGGKGGAAGGKAGEAGGQGNSTVVTATGISVEAIPTGASTPGAANSTTTVSSIAYGQYYIGTVSAGGDGSGGNATNTGGGRPGAAFAFGATGGVGGGSASATKGGKGGAGGGQGSPGAATGSGEETGTEGGKGGEGAANAGAGGGGGGGGAYNAGSGSGAGGEGGNGSAGYVLIEIG